MKQPKEFLLHKREKQGSNVQRVWLFDKFTEQQLNELMVEGWRIAAKQPQDKTK